MILIKEKVNKVKDVILSEKEGVILIAVIKRTDLDKKWDILLSASWVKKPNDEDDLLYLIKILRAGLSDDFDYVSKILVLPPQEQFIQDIVKSIKDAKLPDGWEGELKINDNFIINEIGLVFTDFSNFELNTVTSEVVVKTNQDF